MHAGFDWIWVVIFVVVALSQGWKKVSEQMGGNDDQPVPPPLVPKRPPRPRPARPATAARVPPPLREQPEVWQVGERELRDYVEHVRHVPAPPLPQAVPVPAPPPPEPPPTPEPTAAALPAVPHRQSPRAAQWAAALRDKENLRHVILSAEIIGPPKGL